MLFPMYLKYERRSFFWGGIPYEKIWANRPDSCREGVFPKEITGAELVRARVGQCVLTFNPTYL